MAEIDSSIIVKFLHFVSDYDGEVSIECNFCSDDDYVFANDDDLKGDKDWIAVAYGHVLKYHKKQLKEELARR